MARTPVGLEFATYQRNVVGEKCQWHFARESTLEAALQRSGDGVAERDQVPPIPPMKVVECMLDFFHVRI